MTGLFSKSFHAFDNPILDNYQVVSELGSGGHSTVYLAIDQSGHEVAIKRWLNPDLEPVNRERLMREVEVLRAIEHPHIVRFIELCKDHSGRSCIVMDYVPGQSLRTRLERGVLTHREAVDLTQTLAETLSFLSFKRLVHRDIKPSNVILRESDGAPILIDFSIVKSFCSSEDTEKLLTKTGTSIGTAPYMPPEQCEGVLENPLSVDCRTDIYGVGALLFHGLLGLPPWNNETAWERLTRNPWDNPYPGHLASRDKVVEARELVDKGLSEIVRRCLEGEPKARFQNPKQLQAALSRCRSMGPGRETPGYLVWLLLILSVMVLCSLGLSLSLFPEFNIFFDQSKELNPSSLQNEELKEANMKTSSIISGALVPLMVIASGSEIEAQLYEKTVSNRCAKCLRLYPTGIQKCEIDGDRVNEQKSQTVRNVQSYFPLEDGLRWVFASDVLPQGKGLLKNSRKKTVIQIVDSKMAESNKFTGVKRQLGAAIYVRQNKAGLFRLNAEEKEELVIPYPLMKGQTWKWKPGLPIPVSIRLGNPIATLRGFTKLTMNGKTIHCLTIRISGQSKNKDSIDLYFARDVGLVKYVQGSETSSKRIYKLSNVDSFLILQEDIGVSAIRKVAEKWNHSFFSLKAELFKPLTDYPLAFYALRKGPYLKEGSYLTKGGPMKFASHKELMDRVMKKQLARARPERRWERNKNFALYQVRRVTVKKLQDSAKLFKTLLLGKFGPLYVVTLGDPKRVDSVQLLVTPEGRVFTVFNFD